MARTPQVTRTIQTTKVKVMCLNVVEGKSVTKEVILPRTYKDEKHLMKQLEKVVNDDVIKAVHILETEVNETLYGMSEQKFIENAEILPPRETTVEKKNY